MEQTKDVIIENSFVGVGSGQLLDKPLYVAGHRPAASRQIA